MARSRFRSEQYPEVLWDEDSDREQLGLLRKAQKAAFQDELAPDRHFFLNQARKLMAAVQKHGDLQRMPLILGEQYQRGRRHARRAQARDARRRQVS